MRKLFNIDGYQFYVHSEEEAWEQYDFIKSF